MWRRPKRYRETGQNADLVGSARYNAGLDCHVSGGGNWKELDLRQILKSEPIGLADELVQSLTPPIVP